MSNEKKVETVNIADYLVAKNGKTKYLKIQCSPKADDKTKKLVKDLIALLGTDRLFVNLFTQEFKDEYGIPDFAKGRIAIETNPKPSTDNEEPVQAKSKSSSKSKDEINF